MPEIARLVRLLSGDNAASISGQVIRAQGLDRLTFLSTGTG